MEQLKEALDAAVTTLDGFNAHCESQPGLATISFSLLSLTPAPSLSVPVSADESQVKAFNARTDAAQSEIDAANTAYEQALEARNTQQDKTYQARDDFNIAALHLADEVELCNQPQPPSTCGNDLKAAEAAVTHTNTTQTEENAKLDAANAQLDAAYTGQQMAQAAYQKVVEMQDKEIASMQGEISDAQGAVQTATAAWQDADQKCHRSGRRHR